MELKNYIRSIPDFPKKGIIFRDITTLLKEPMAFRRACELLTEPFLGKNVTKVIGIESRGFIFSSVVAVNLSAGLVPVRKPGKLPWKTVKKTYSLEYGEDSLEIHIDSISKGDRVILIDDLIATGGTAKATLQLVEELGGEVVGAGFLIELSFLKGRDKLKDYDVYTIIKYESESL